MYRRFPLIDEINHGEWGYRTSEPIVRDDTATFPVSWRRMFWNSYLYVVVIYNFICTYLMQEQYADYLVPFGSYS